MRRKREQKAVKGLGFTLLELLIVMVIIGIIVAFILTAALDGLRRAEERGTQALIAKIDAGLADRYDALTLTRADYNAAHAYMAAIWVANGNLPYIPDKPGSIIPAGIPRAAVIAQFDRLKAEMPDVFTVQTDQNYLFNFAAMPFPGTHVSFVSATYAPYLLPLGVGIINNGTNSFGGNPSPLPVSNSNPAVIPNSTGIFGASYAAAGGLTKQLATVLSGSPNWYDGTDNNNNGLVDEIGESGLTYATVSGQMANHTHKTARSEMLYALLVYGIGPLGSTFSPDDFSDSEVKDTDGDGLLEFVDAWGEPLQFYRWPIYYYGQDIGRPDSQRGYLKYGLEADGVTVDVNAAPIATRQQNALDPNQQLVAPAWWSSGVNGAGISAVSGPLSGGANLFQQFFHSLVDPNANPLVSSTYGPTTGLWDRGNPATQGAHDYHQRREYYSRPLVLSSGPDKLAGVPRIDNAYFQALAGYAGQKYANGQIVDGAGLASFSGVAMTDTPSLLIECQAAQATINRSNDAYHTPLSLYNTGTVDTDITASLQDVGADDLTNQNLAAPGGAIQ